MYNVEGDPDVGYTVCQNKPIIDGTGDDVGLFTGVVIFNRITRETIKIVGHASYHTRYDYENNKTFDNVRANICGDGLASHVYNLEIA